MTLFGEVGRLDEKHRIQRGKSSRYWRCVIQRAMEYARTLKTDGNAWRDITGAELTTHCNRHGFEGVAAAFKNAL